MSAAEMILTFHSPERPGLVHAVTGVLAAQGGDVVELKQFDDPHTEHFFLRVHVRLSPDDGAETPDVAAREQVIRDGLTELATEVGATWDLRPHGQRRRLLVMASKSDHCLNDLLYRCRIGDLPAEIAAVVSNHPDHRELVEWHGIPYFCVPVTPDTKPQAEAQLLELVARFEVDLVVLARYMQILSDDLSRELSGRAINIHHSFLPSFKGAKPYHQAFERGVKTVGATAHYVNDELDEGPIISQRVMDVDHTYGPEDLVAVGRDSECRALSEAVRWHCEGRVFLNGVKTVVLR
ncbi:formyltetrahydrofolate deformylase [Nesterenkonia marinintestina]|uniref:formyltetrahydrofolate deformylase n=1 Tax=Nesterenkonia marinintestina TaxID=2979865 RepID=UPI0021BF7AB0|nr:formyltetrahydrofolate deformylase [Nesterenkonia sp. GX14115]